MPDFTITTSDGRKFRVTAPDRQSAMAALQGQLDGQASSQPQPEGDTSMGTAFNVGTLQAMDLGRTGVSTANRALEDSFVGNTLNFLSDKVGNPVREALGFDPVDRRANAAQQQAALEAEAARAQGATEDYIESSGFQNMTTGDIDGFGDLMRYTGQKVANTAPMMMGAIGSGGMITYPLSVGELSQNLDEIEGISQEQKDNLALGGGAIMTALENLGLSKLLPKGSNGTIIGGIAEGLITEGTTEGLQELVAIGAEAVAGKEFAEGEISNRLREAAVAGAVVGGTVRGGTQTASNLGTRIFNSDGTVVDPESLQGMERQAAASLAQRLRGIADNNGYDLRDVGNAGHAKQTLEAAHEAITDRLKEVASYPEVRSFLDSKQAKTLDQLLDDYAAAHTALRQGRNKVKSQVTQENFDAIMRLLPPSKEAAEIANLLREGNVLTQLFKNGTRGGISQYTDTFNPFTAEDGTYDPTKAISRIANVGLAITTTGGSVPAQLGVTVAGRGIDKLTGRRSAVDRFVRTNEGNETLPAPRGPSLVAARALEAQQQAEAEAQAAERKARLTEQERQLNLDLVRRGAPPAGDINNPDSQSPQFIVENATGLDRSGVARILRIMKANPNTQPAILRAIEGYEKSIAEGGRVPLMTPLIRAIKQFQSANPEYQGAPSAGPTPPTGGPTQPQSPQFGGQFTTPENYQRGIQDNIDFRENLAAELQADESLTPVVKAQVATGLDALGMNLGSAPVESVQTIVQGLQDQGVPQDVIDTYVTPYADRVISQQARQPAQMNIPTAPQAGPDVQSDAPAQPPRPRFDQAAPQITPPSISSDGALGTPAPQVMGQLEVSGNNHGLMPHLRVEAPEARTGKPLVMSGTNNKNAPRQIEGIDEVLSRHEDPAASPEAWAAMMGDALAQSDVPVPPYGFIRDLNEGGAENLLSKLTEGQIADADHGFQNAAAFREAYTSGQIGLEDTGRLFLWSFLSRGVSPYTQESLFMDSFSGIGPFIKMASDGTLKDNMAEYKAWAKTVAPKGSGKPGAGATHNLNAFGELFLLKMSEPAGNGDSRSRLQVLHDMMSDPNTTGRQIRREFMRMAEGVGIDNKVVSFTLLVAGYDDVMVLDRVQMRQMWNDGRFDGINLYDGYKVDGKPVNGSALSSLTYGARGLLVYEAMENSLQKRLQTIYANVGRPEAASVGRYHWETWVASSQQEASHATIDAILAGAKGDPNPLEGVTAKEGEYGAYAYGARYGIENGTGVFTYTVPDRGDYKFTVPEFREFLEQIKKPKNKVVPKNFKVTDSGNAPWYTREGVDLDALAEKANEYGKQIRRTDGKLRQGQNLPDVGSPSSPVGGTGARLSQQAPRSPVAGILAQRITGSGDPAVSPRVTNPPEVPEVKASAKDVVEKIEVGKRGSKYENGIKDLAAVKRLADAMNITLMMFDNFSDMQAAVGGDIQSTTLGAFIPERRTAYAMNAGAIDGSGNEVSELQSFVTALHEVSHGIASDDISTGQFADGYVSKPNYLKEGKRDYAAAYSLEHVVGHLVADKGAKKNAILAEILHLQKNASLSQGGNSLPMREGNALRNSISAMRRSATRRGQDRASFDKQYREALQEANDYFDYEVSIPELTVDPMIMYLYDPKTMKRVAPNTAALIKGLFDKANNPKIQFFSHPLAMVIAIVAAILARQEMAAGEEEQQKRQMQAGLLTQQPTMGALSV